MRYIAVAALPVLCALTGCAHWQSSPPASVPGQPSSAPARDTGSGAPNATPSPDQPSARVSADQSEPSPPPNKGNAGSAPAPTRPASTSKDAKSQSQAASPTKPKSSTPRSPSNPPAATSSTAVSKPATSPSATPPQPPPPPPSASAPVKANPPTPTAAALDLTSLEQRLRETRAIGVFTKLSLKNQVDDLLGQFRAFHNRRSTLPLSELRQKYDLLLLKVLSLLQDGDPPLASAVSGSREAIWGILSDPQKFAKL